MTTFLEATIASVGRDVPGLLRGGILILYGLDAPPELAEVAVRLRIGLGLSAEPAPVGARLRIGTIESPITALGEETWPTLAAIGHVVVRFNGAIRPERAGELCAAPVAIAALSAELREGTPIVIAARAVRADAGPRS